MIWTTSQFCREKSGITSPMKCRYHNAELISGYGTFRIPPFRQPARSISRMIFW
jgi:hypothetical protein